MADRSTSPFQYAPDDLRRIRDALEEVKALTKTDWPHVLAEIMEIARRARRDAHRPRVPYSNNAAQRATRLADALYEAMLAYDALGLELQAAIEVGYEHALDCDPVFVRAFTPTERAIVHRLVDEGRFFLPLLYVIGSAQAVSEHLPLGEKPFVEIFPKTGKPKEQVIREAIPHLAALYRRITGREPTVYQDAYDEARRYSGKFFYFAQAALAPLGLIHKRSLPSAIYKAYRSYRGTLKM